MREEINENEHEYPSKLHGVSRCLSGGIVFAAKSIGKQFYNEIIRENILPSNTSRYSVAFCGVFCH